MDHLLVKIILLSCVVNAVVFAGDDCDDVDLSNDEAVLTSLDFSVACNVASIVVSIDPCIVERMGYDPATEITINGDQDHATGTVCADISPDTTSGWTMTIDDPFNQCGTTGEEDSGDIVYSNHLQTIGYSNSVGDVIARRKNIKLPFSCTYTALYNENGEKNLVPVLTLNEAESTDEDGDFAPSVYLCTTSECSGGSDISSGDSVDILTDVCIIIETTMGLETLFLNVQALDDLKSKDVTTYFLLEDQCIPGGEEDYVSRPDPGTGKTTLCFSMFHWANGNVADPVYLNLEYELCDPNVSDCSYDDCTGKGRRRRSPRLEVSSNPTAIYRTTLGPLKAHLV